MEVGSSTLPGTTRARGVQAVYVECDGGLAQLARAPALQAGGQRFESVILHTALKIGRTSFDMLDNTNLKCGSNAAPEQNQANCNKEGRAR